MLEHLLNAGVKLAGGLMDRSAAKDANATRIALANQEYERQKEFAQMGISWKVKDALSAGVHPLFALGASTSSYAPQSIGVEKTGLGPTLADMGQDVSRAVASASPKAVTQAIAARDAVQLDGLKLDNDIKRATLAKALKDLAPPAAGTPIPGHEDPSKVKRLVIGGQEHHTDPKTSSAQDFEDRYGEMSDFIYGPQIWLRDRIQETEPFMGEEQWKRFRAAVGRIFGF